MDAPQRSAAELGSALRAARRSLGMSQAVLALEVARQRQRQRLSESEPESIRRQLIDFERGRRVPGVQWRRLLADALERPEEELFGAYVDSRLPRPLLVQSRVTPDVVDVMLAQRVVHARAEHTFGPVYAQQLVDRDLMTIESLIRVTPPELRKRVRLVAALIAELGGWIAQDSGDSNAAQRLTARAAEHGRGAAANVRAMILMRRSNVMTDADPDLAVELADDAAALVERASAGRLPASIARQQAIAALSARDEQGFVAHIARAADLAEVEPTADDLTVYAGPAYVTSEQAYGLLVMRRPEAAVDLLRQSVQLWPPGQQRDLGVARARLLRALVMVRDYAAAITEFPHVAQAYLAVPSARTRRELRRTRDLVREHARATSKPLPLIELRRRLDNALEGDPLDG